MLPVFGFMSVHFTIFRLYSNLNEPKGLYIFKSSNCVNFASNALGEV